MIYVQWCTHVPFAIIPFPFLWPPVPVFFFRPQGRFLHVEFSASSEPHGPALGLPSWLCQNSYGKWENTIGKPWENDGFSWNVSWDLPSGNLLHRELERSTMFHEKIHENPRNFYGDFPVHYVTNDQR